MNPSALFQISSLFAGIGWIVVIFISPYWKDFDKFLIGFVIALLALVYTWLNFSNFSPDILKNFSSLEGVMTVFQNPELVTAGWVHFLAFDLLGAVWIKRNSLQNGIGHAWIIPSLVFTCIFGPLGYLIYLLTRWIKTKNYFSVNF
ncbi:ABA4-like family protein [Flavitalea flava]